MSYYTATVQHQPNPLHYARGPVHAYIHSQDNAFRAAALQNAAAATNTPQNQLHANFQFVQNLNQNINYTMI